MTKTTDFWEWAEAELDRRGLNWYKVEMIAGVSNNSISGRARELLPPTDHTAKAIAKAFNLPPESIMRRAGILPPEPAESEQLNEVIHLFNQLSPTEQAIILEQVRAIAARYSVPRPSPELDADCAS